MNAFHRVSRVGSRLVMGGMLVLAAGSLARGGEPDPASYWDVKDVRPGMKGTGRTVMVGTQLEEFEAEVLGVMRGVSPGRDMILCRLKGCDLEHAGIIQGMSGSPIYIDGKLLGAVAYAWEFAKDPIAGVTPFSQMVEFARAADRRIAAGEAADVRRASVEEFTPFLDCGTRPLDSLSTPVAVSSGGLGGMRAITTPLAATGLSPRALAALGEEVAPLGMAPMAGGGVLDAVLAQQWDTPLAAGSPLCIALISGDFDLSAIGTVTHVEGDRVYGFGHPMFSLGQCEFPLMTGYIHTVYPRASVSMKMGSPLRVVGVLDSDVSTGISGRIGPKPDLLPMTVRVHAGRFSEPKEYRVQLARHPKLLSSLAMSVLTSAIDTEGDLPEDLTAHVTATLKLKGHDPIAFEDTVSGPRYAGPTGASALFSPVGSLVSMVARNPIEPLRIESIDCVVAIECGRTTAEIESLRLANDRIAPGENLALEVHLRPYQGDLQTVRVEVPIPAGMPDGVHELTVCDSLQSLRKRATARPDWTQPHSIASLLEFVRVQAQLSRTQICVHLPLENEGVAVDDQPLPDLPRSVRAVLDSSRQSQLPTIHSAQVSEHGTRYVIEGSQSISFEIRKPEGLAFSGE